jgi:hypothetical protein
MNIAGLIAYLFGEFNSFEGLATGGTFTLDAEAVAAAVGQKLSVPFDLSGKKYNVDVAVTVTRTA